MKQREAAELLGISRPYVAQLLKGSRLPSVTVVVKAGNALGCDDAEIGASVREWASSESDAA